MLGDGSSAVVADVRAERGHQHQRLRKQVGDALHGRCHDRSEVSEFGEQGLGERLGVLARNGAEKEELEQFVVGERSGPAIFEAFAQARAVVVVVRLFWFRARRLGARNDERCGAIELKRKKLAVFDARSGRALALDDLWQRADKWRWLAPASLALSAAMFAYFYPIISAAPLCCGRPSYVQWMWLDSWR